MDQPMDPPPICAEAGSPAAGAAPYSANAANPTPNHPPVHSHPPYAEMITAAIAALNERNGSSKKAIAKYIESHYSHLPPTHLALLSHHLKRLNNNGQILMVKYSYKLPRASISAAANGSVSNSAISVPKKRPGRPFKSESVQAAVPVFGEETIPGELQTGAGRSGGRPKKIGAPPAARVKRLGRVRGRPRKVSNSQAAPAFADCALPVAGETVQDGGKSRGRPPKDGAAAESPGELSAGDSKKPRKLGGKPLGGPKKDASEVPTQTLDNQLLMAYLALKGKLDFFQSKIKQTTSIIKPHLNHETAVSALQELETLAKTDIGALNALPPELQTAKPSVPKLNFVPVNLS